jgi:hypothetical protein
VGKRIVVAAAAVFLLGGAYAAGAVGPSVATVSGRRLEALKAVTSVQPQTVTVHDLPAPGTPIPGARLALTVRTGEQGVFDIRFTSLVTNSSANFDGDILVDGLALAPLSWPYINNLGNGAERVTGPLAPGRHVVTVDVESPYTAGGSRQVALAGWTLVAEEVRASA